MRLFDFAALPDVTDQLGPAALALLEQYAAEQFRLMRENPLTYGHTPHAGQEEFLSSTSRRRLLVCANRWGKTEVAMREILWLARGDHPYKQTKLCKTIWVGAPDYPSYLRYHKPAFDQWCPPGWIVGAFNSTDKYVDIRRIDGGVCRIFFLSYDMPRSKWQGAGVDAIWLDEEMPEDLYNEASARLVTTRGLMLLTFTPVSGIGWTHDRIYLPGLRGENGYEVMQFGLATRDLSAELEIGEPLVPHLTREDILDFARTYPDPDERAARVFGEYRSRSGIIYRQLTEAHSVESFPIPRHWTLFGAADPGFHGFAFLLFALAPNGDCYVVWEMFSQQELTADRFSRIRGAIAELRAPVAGRTREGEDPYAMLARLGEPEAEAEAEPVVVFVDTEDPQTVMELNQHAYASKTPVAFVSLEQGNKAVKAGILRVQQVLANIGTGVTLRFFKSLYSEWRRGDKTFRGSRVLWEMARYSWKQPPRGKAVVPDEPDKESAGGAHMLDALRYAVMARLGAPSEPQQRRESNPRADDYLEQMLDEEEARVLAQQEEAEW